MKLVGGRLAGSTTHPAFDALPADVASDAVWAVEDAVDAHIEPTHPVTGLDDEHGPAVVRALLDLGWRPPAPTTPLGDIADT